MANRDFTQFHLREALDEFTGYGVPFGVICLQIDNFDHFRGAYGREAADTLVATVAESFSTSLRPSDFVGRWADDQFLAILLNCGGQGAMSAAQRIRKSVACAGIRWWGDQISVTTSIGAAAAEPGDTQVSLLHRAQPEPSKLAASAVSAGGCDNPEG